MLRIKNKFPYVSTKKVMLIAFATALINTILLYREFNGKKCQKK